MIGWDEWYESQHGESCGCSGCDGTDKLLRDRGEMLAELERAIGPRPSVASVLRMLRLRRGGRR